MKTGIAGREEGLQVGKQGLQVEKQELQVEKQGLQVEKQENAVGNLKNHEFQPHFCFVYSCFRNLYG